MVFVVLKNVPLPKYSPFSVGIPQCKYPPSCPGDSAVTKCGVAQEELDKSEKTYTARPWHVDISWVGKFTSRVLMKLVIKIFATVMFHFMDFWFVLPCFPVFCYCFLWSCCSRFSFVALVWWLRSPVSSLVLIILCISCSQFYFFVLCCLCCCMFLLRILSVLFIKTVAFRYFAFLRFRWYLASDLENAEGLYWRRAWFWQLHTA